jgi:hypothetical protein
MENRNSKEDGLFSQNNDLVVKHFNHSAFDFEGLFLFLGINNLEGPLFQGRNDRSVLVQNPEFAITAGKQNRFDFTAEELFVGGYYFQEHAFGV